MIDFNELSLETIQSQYGASPHLKGVIFAIAKQLDPNADIDKFYEKIFNLDTAEGVGLDIWGLVVAVERPTVANNDFFGFYGSGLHPFGQAPFYCADVSKAPMSDDVFRKVIYYKALGNISEDTAQAQRELLGKLFSSPPAVITVGTMQIRVLFQAYLPESEVEILKKYGLLNRGAGVGWEFYQIDTSSVFGFDGSGLQPFDCGVFDPSELQTGL